MYKNSMKKALFPGTFDPYTIGHDALVRRALNFIDEIVIGIGANIEKNAYQSPDERLDFISKVYSNEPRVTVASYNILTVDFAKEIKADFILRGVRNINDFEYEKNIAEINRKLSDIETILLISEAEYEYISSNLIRELAKYKKDYQHLIPKTVNNEQLS
jgi:pantetheine-phosphate adenylyltransferase